ncbi:hypothetical protein ACFQ3J_06675 [Paenibacillus provencensis]|uniref:Uncharacterized protein n=1 Tax=Paenibacillus provencensis TaxID=441151 RepID=A0ABW3PLZ8_9BACL|nr:hypothetical protein [Paenibacillus sp. MER 78]
MAAFWTQRKSRKLCDLKMPLETEANTRKITITIGNQVIDAELNDSKAAQVFKKILSCNDIDEKRKFDEPEKASSGLMILGKVTSDLSVFDTMKGSVEMQIKMAE